jgi:hypothetical protein
MVPVDSVAVEPLLEAGVTEPQPTVTLLLLLSPL